MSENTKYIVTSALPYVNGVKHLGNLVGSLLPADIYARWLRLTNKDVIAICGTDEHGTPAELSAKGEGLPVKDYVDKYYKIQKEIYERFGINFDHFGRTSTKLHHDLMHEVFANLKKNGFIKKKKITQVFCEDCQRFLPDRYVTGTCPKCGYERARGDQCENCTSVLDSNDLINPRCEICSGNNVKLKESTHFFLKLDEIAPKLEKWVNSNDNWPKTTKSIAKQWLKDGLQERCITRDLSWGIPVNEPGFENKVFYVWMDAPWGYISITQEWAQKIGKPDIWKDYWKDQSTRLIQFLAKDNVPFHTITWPATLMGVDDGYILADYVKGFQWLNYEGGKFSTSQNRGIFTDVALELFPADIWRYILISIAPERHDTDFTWNEFKKVVNSDLANSLGNFVNRVLHFINQNFDGIIPKAGKLNDIDKELFNDIESTVKKINSLFEELEFQKTLFAIRDLVIQGNKYFQQQQPWKLVKDDKERAATVLNVGAHFTKSLAMLLSPFIPFTATKIYKYLGIKSDVHKETWDKFVDTDSLTGNKIEQNPEILFNKVSDKELKPIIEQFSGKEASESDKPDVKGKQKKKKKKEKKESSTTENKKNEYATIDDFIKLGLKIATIKKIENVEGSDKLYKLIIDIGTEERQIIAGLAEVYSKEELLGSQIAVITNLKPRKFKKYNVESQGMLLAAEGDKMISLLRPDKKLPPGSDIH